MDMGFEWDKTKGWKSVAETQARAGEDVSLGSGRGRWTLDEGQAGWGAREGHTGVNDDASFLV